MTSFGIRPSLGLSHSVDTHFYFSRAIDCDMTELESVLDYFAPENERKGNWAHNPRPKDKEEAYRTCYNLLQDIDPETPYTVAQLIRQSLANRGQPREREGSEAIFELMRTVAKYLPQKEEERQ